MVNPMSLEGRVLLVTGASSGIGRETSVLLSQLGAKVVLVGRNREQLNATVGKLRGAPCRVEPFDLNQIGDINAWLKRVGTEEGGLHGFVHCAGMPMTRPLPTRLALTMTGPFARSEGGIADTAARSKLERVPAPLPAKTMPRAPLFRSAPMSAVLG